MQGRHILVLILLAAAVIVGGCTTTEGDTTDTQPSPQTPAPTEVQAVGGNQPAPTPAVPTRGEE
ncbi:MAG: hypothetical protein ACOX7V_09725, partial [Methanoculleus thermophilus]